MKRILEGFRLLALASLTVLAANATTILDVTSSVALGDPTQFGRLSRNGIAQDWDGGEDFPGIINPGTAYHYQTYSVNVGVNSFVQIDIDDIAGLGRTFASAYEGSYLPNSSGSGNRGFDTNWLGDAGRSGNSFGTDPQFFQVIVPVDGILQIVVNTTAASNGGVGDSYRLIVEGYIDSSFTDAPEPSALILGGGGLMLLALVKRRKRKL